MIRTRKMSSILCWASAFCISVTTPTNSIFSAEPKKDKAGVAIYSVVFGGMDADSNVSETRKIKHALGDAYGWKLEVSSTAGKVRVKEVFTLPEPAEWGSVEPEEDSGIRVISRKVSKDRRTQTSELELNVGDKTFVLPHRYHIIEGDPKGKHEIVLELDGQEIDRFRFTLE